jgi:SNF2 family DNA or RNA helicase
VRLEGQSLYWDKPASQMKLEAAAIPGLKVFSGQATGDISALSAAKVALGTKPLVFTDLQLYEEQAYLAAFQSTVSRPLREYQKNGVWWLANTLRWHQGAILADDMGLGKTLQALTTMRILNPARVLVVCPAAARETWRDELKKWGVESVAVLSPAAIREWRFAPKARVVVSSYDHRIVDRCMDIAFANDVPQMVILDEAHRIRGRKSKRSKKLEDVLPLANYRLALTGTPQFDRPRDLYQILRLLFGYRFGNQYDFDRRYCAGKINTHGGMDNEGVSNEEELKLRLSYYMLRREKADVASELPALTRQVRWVDCTPEAKRAWHAAHVGFSKYSLHTALVATLKGKMEEAMDLAEEAKRFLLLTWLKEHAHQMTRVLSLDRKTPCVCITGEMSTEKRSATIKEAAAKGWGIVGTLDSLSESLNMQGVASVGIMHYIPWEPRKAAQAEGRLHRLGQVDPVVWNYTAMRDSADMAVMKTFVQKLDQGRVTVGEKANRKLRHDIGDAVDGPQSVANEKAALAQIYKEMGDENSGHG